MVKGNDTLKFAPRLPEGITRLAFNLESRCRRLRVETTPSTASYVLTRGDDLELFHFDEATIVPRTRPSAFDAKHDDRRPSLSTPSQPFGRVLIGRVANSSIENQEAS